MSNYHLIVIVAGWFYAFYVSSRAISRSEISRLKDRLIDKIDCTQEWFSCELKENTDFLNLELELSAKVTQIEFKINQLNHYIKYDVFKLELISSLRNVEVSDSVNVKVMSMSYSEASFDLIESIETIYDHHYFRRGFFYRLWIRRKVELFGLISALAACLLYVLIFKLVNMS